jgi:hypothetical protein
VSIYLFIYCITKDVTAPLKMDIEDPSKLIWSTLAD